jgi:hypothetical protein
MASKKLAEAKVSNFADNLETRSPREKVSNFNGQPQKS